MKKLYIYNAGTRTLHIKNGCQYAKNPEYKAFDTENEARAFANGEIKMCKLCLAKRDKKLSEVDL